MDPKARRVRSICIVAAGIAVMSILCGCDGQSCGWNRQIALVRSPPPPIFSPRVGHTVGSTSTADSRGMKLSALGDRGLWVPSVRERPWRFIVIHHSATDDGSAAEFDRMHRANGWDELGYHFVIGNGFGSGDGLVETGPRWLKQKHGAHCKVANHPEYNDFGIGICLVGNFNETYPSRSQMDALVALVRFLQARYRIPQNRIFGHGQLKATDCPGRYFSYHEFRRRISQ